MVILNQLQGWYANSWSFFCIVKNQLHPWTAPQRRPKGSLLQVPTSIHWLNYVKITSFLFWTPNLSIYPNLKSASAYASSMPFFVPQTGGKNHPKPHRPGVPSDPLFSLTPWAPRVEDSTLRGSPGQSVPVTSWKRKKGGGRMKCWDNVLKKRWV